MPEWLTNLLPEDWSGRDLAIAAIIVTVATFVVSLVAVGIVLVRIPSDYFVGDHPPRAWTDRHPFVRIPFLILKNLFGVFLMILGLALSLPGVPGQGILTILIGVMLVDLPGKRRAERWVLRRRGVLTGINKLRARYGRPPLQLDAPPPTL